MKAFTTFASAAALALTVAAAAAPANATVFVNIATSGETGTNQISWTGNSPGKGTVTISGIQTHLDFDNALFNDAGGNEALLTLTGTATSPSLLTLGPIFLQGGLTGSFEFVLMSNPSIVLLHGDFTNFWMNGVVTGTTGNLTSGGPGATLNLTSAVVDLSKIFDDNASFSFTNVAPSFGITGVGPLETLNNFQGSNVAGTFGGSIPEPASWALMILGFGGVGAMVRRRKISAALA